MIAVSRLRKIDLKLSIPLFSRRTIDQFDCLLLLFFGWRASRRGLCSFEGEANLWRHLFVKRAFSDHGEVYY